MERKLVQISQRVWYWPAHPDPRLVQASVGVIVGKKHTIIVDAGNSPMMAEQVRLALSQSGFPPVRNLIFTHHHWDHVWGACVFDVPAIAHKKCKAILDDKCRKPWSAEYLRLLAKSDPRFKRTCEARQHAITDWSNFRIVVPDTIFEDFYSVRLDDISIELEHVGGDHAEDSIVVKVPQDKVVFLGDCYYPPPLHLQTEPASISTTILARVIDQQMEYYVDGHNKPMSRKEISEYLKNARQ